MSQAVDLVKFPPITATQAASWMVGIQVGERESTAYAATWREARYALAQTVTAMFKAGLLPEWDTRFVLETLTNARDPNEGHMSAWCAASATPFWRFVIHSPLGMRA